MAVIQRRVNIKTAKLKATAICFIDIPDAFFKLGVSALQKLDVVGSNVDFLFKNNMSLGNMDEFNLTWSSKSKNEFIFHIKNAGGDQSHQIDLNRIATLLRVQVLSVLKCGLFQKLMEKLRILFPRVFDPSFLDVLEKSTKYIPSIAMSLSQVLGYPYCLIENKLYQMQRRIKPKHKKEEFNDIFQHFVPKKPEKLEFTDLFDGMQFQDLFEKTEFVDLFEANVDEALARLQESTQLRKKAAKDLEEASKFHLFRSVLKY